jgi:hypothetical protein
MQIRGLSSPWELPARTLSTSTACQSALPCCPTSPLPSNAPLGAGLCIFNKFRESSASRRSRPAVAALKAAFRLPRKRCPRVYLCARRESSQSSSRIRSVLPIPVREISRAPRSGPPPSPRARGILFPLAFEQLAFHRSLLLPVFFFCHSPAPPPAPSRALSRARFISARCQFEFGAQDNACLLKTSF